MRKMMMERHNDEDEEEEEHDRESWTDRSDDLDMPVKVDKTKTKKLLKKINAKPAKKASKLEKPLKEELHSKLNLFL